MTDKQRPATTGAALRGPRAPAGKSVVTVLLAMIVVGAGTVVAARAVSTSSARISATTDTRSLLEAGVVHLDRPDQSETFAFAAENLYPGKELRGCLVLDYSGSVGATVRLHAAGTGGTGLDEFVDVQFLVLPGAECVDNAIVGPRGSATELYSGRLRRFWTTHSSFATGLAVAQPDPDDQLVVESIVNIVDDERAAGLTTEFEFTFEARPR